MKNRKVLEFTRDSFDWCYTAKFTELPVYVSVYQGDIEAILYNGEDHRPVTAEDIHRLAVRLNHNYDLYRGWDDKHILLDAENEILPCCECPWNDICDYMEEESDFIPKELEDEEDEEDN